MKKAPGRLGAVVLAFSLLLGPLGAIPASAQSSSETGIIQITVKDAAAQQALADARVFLVGPTVASALTTKSGIVKYTDVPSGIYRVRVNKSGYTGVTSGAFEVLGNKQVAVDVDLGVQKPATTQTSTSTTDTGGLKIIGSVRARVTVVTTDVDDSSAVRRISDSLTDALSTIGGVDVTQDSNDPNAPQTISLRGRDESQTAVTLDGIPLGAPGAATNLRAINTDLFSGAGVNFGAQAGALGGSVNFRTLQPTQTWQTKFSSSYGTFDKYNFQIGETGSIGKLGIALLHTKRAGNSPLTFQTYLDQSGIDYSHAGESANIGDFVKLRYGLGESTTLLFTALQNNQASAALCTQFVTPLPCGIGPDNGNSGKFQFMYGTVQSLIGQTAISLTGYVNNNVSNTNDVNRFLQHVCRPGDTLVPGCTPGTVSTMLQPYAAQNGSLARGLAASATLTRDKHTITLSGSTYAAVTTFMPLVGGNGFVIPSTFATASRQVQLADQFKVNDKLTLGPNLSFAGTSGSGSSLLAGFSAAWRPTGSDTYSGSISVGSSQAANGLVRSPSDPYAARINCFADTAQVSGPGDLPGHQSALSYDASWTHSWAHGQFSLSTYRQTQSGQLVGAQVTANSIGLDPSSPYYQAVTGYFDNACGTSAVPNLYVQQQIGGTTRLYQGYTATARIGLGPNIVVIPSYSTQVSEVTAANPRYVGLDSTLILGEQIPGRPLHTGNVTIDALHPHSGTEFLLNARYVGANNNQRLAPYTLVNAGLSHALGIGRITLFASNLFNTETGDFSTLLYAQPIPLSGGGTLLQAANPNTPRQYTVTYTFNTGARPGAGFSRGSANARGGQTAGAAGTQGQQRGGLGFGRLQFIAPPPGVDPLSIAASRKECTPELKPEAQKVLGQLGLAAAAYKGGQTALPAVEGITITPHGDPTSPTWYFGLGPSIPDSVLRTLQQRAAGQSDGPRAPGPGGPGGGPGGPGGPGGEPGGFQPRVVVAAPTSTGSPRPQFSPPPELIAALAPLRAVSACAYGTVLTTTEAHAKGYDVQAGVQVAAAPSPSPGASAVPAARANPASSPAPAPSGSPGPGGRGNRGFGNALYYAPNLGLFVVRPPDLGTGGGSVKQP
jgi:hypothetical protein